MIVPIVILPAPTPSGIGGLAMTELEAMESAENAEEFWMTLVEEEGESGVIPERTRMDSGGIRRDSAVPPRYEDENWPLYTQERRGSISTGIAM